MSTTRVHDAAAFAGRHGTGCRCEACGHIEVMLNFGQPDDALFAAYEDGIVRDADIELAFLIGADPLRLAGFTNTSVRAR